MTLTPPEWAKLVDRLAAAGEIRAAERLRAGLAQAYGSQAEAVPLSLHLPAGIEAAVERIGTP